MPHLWAAPPTTGVPHQFPSEETHGLIQPRRISVLIRDDHQRLQAVLGDGPQARLIDQRPGDPRRRKSGWVSTAW
jgi:hypothetical protein